MNGRPTTSHDKLVQFKFVQIDQPGSAVDERVRRQVKSHVSRWQHRQERERQFAIASRSQGIAKNSDKGSATRARDTSEQTADTNATHEDDGEEQFTPPLVSPSASSLERSFSRGSVAFRTIALKDPNNLVGKNIAGLGLDLSNIMGF